ncbi:MAG TPA: sigma-70 family RNA polymerase sigma factor [Acidimicrobiia bacterium]|nr:sigma-70 family RNA polymerase sigma factor [Acidimicrobiia bacterium]
MRVGRGRAEAFEEFCRDEYSALVASIAMAIGDRDVAADAVSEALARAWNRVRRGHDIDTLGAWIRVVALRIGYDAHRRRAVERKHQPHLVAVPSVASESWGAALDVRDALRMLPPRQREVAALYFICDLTIPDIARTLKISESTAQTSLQRARITLTHALDDTERKEARRDAS